MEENISREENSLADELSKLIIPDYWMLRRDLFMQLEWRWSMGTPYREPLCVKNEQPLRAFFSLH